MNDKEFPIDEFAIRVMTYIEENGEEYDRYKAMLSIHPISGVPEIQTWEYDFPKPSLKELKDIQKEKLEKFKKEKAPEHFIPIIDELPKKEKSLKEGMIIFDKSDKKLKVWCDGMWN